jgi:hypothetical protein
MDRQFYRTLADCVLLTHLGLVLFIVAGLVLVLLGGRYHWRWVRNVMAESWLGLDCPLTTLEQWLRIRAGQAGYEEDFIAHWVGKLLFYHAPPWVFTSVYSAFALLVAISWIGVRPRRRR